MVTRFVSWYTESLAEGCIDKASLRGKVDGGGVGGDRQEGLGCKRRLSNGGSGHFGRRRACNEIRASRRWRRKSFCARLRIWPTAAATPWKMPQKPSRRPKPDDSLGIWQTASIAMRRPKSGRLASSVEWNYIELHMPAPKDMDGRE